MFDALKFYQDNSIQYISSGHKHARPGWVQIKCPFCTGHEGWHLGYCINESDSFAGKYVCYRCGSHSVVEVIRELISCTWNRATSIKRQYTSALIRSYVLDEQIDNKNKYIKLPIGTKEMTEVHISYLERRKFDPDKLKSLWNLKGTGPIGSYSHRIILPIYYQGVLVSYQGRDITGLCDDYDKYKACSKRNEIIHHKETLYGLDDAKKESVLVVEGAADVWRMGKGCVATFGIKFTMSQALLLSQFDKVYILFDKEEQAQKQAHKLEALLNMNTEAYVLEYDESDDPGSMKQEDADYLMRYLGIN